MSESRQSADLFLLAPDGKRRARAFLRFLAFVALSCVFIFVPLFAVALLLVSSSVLDPTADLEWGLALQLAAQALGALAATALMARITGRKLRDFGLGGSDRWRNFLIGVATGLASFSLLLLAMRFASVVSFEPAAGTGRAAVLEGAVYILLMLGVGFSEESLFRGYALAALSESISFWPAALATGTLFGLLHAFNEGETVPGLVSAALFGIILAYSYRRTRSLWFAFGIHASWDYAESFIFGAPNSGQTLPGGLLQPQFDGPAWLTGGSAGPEGSVLMLFVLGAMLLVIRIFLRPAGSANVRPASATALAATVGSS